MSGRMELTSRLTQTLYREARLLDDCAFEDWLDMLAPDLDYTVEIQQDLAAGYVPQPGHRLNYMNETLATFQLRVLKIRTGLQQTELPSSRVVRLVSNIELVDAGASDAHEVHSAFVLYRNHRQRDVEILAGRRTDEWQEIDGRFQLRRRVVRFAANVLPTKSLSLFY